MIEEVVLPNVNPFDRTSQHSFEDLPPVGETEEERRYRELGAPAREEALVHNSAGRGLTDSAGFAMLAEYTEGQRQATMNKLLLTPITEANKDELNYERGIVHGLMLAVKFARAMAEGAQATLELFKEQERMNDRSE